MSLHTPSLMSAGRGVTIISPDGSHRIPVDLQADYAAIVLLDPEPAEMARWVRRLEDGLGVRDVHRAYIAGGLDAVRAHIRGGREPERGGRSELPRTERGRTADELRRLDRLCAKLARTDLKKKARDEAEAELAALLAAPTRAADQAWRERAQIETLALADARNEAAERLTSGAVRVNSRDPLMSLLRAGKLNAAQYDAGVECRNCYDARSEDAGSQMGSLAATRGAHDNDRFVHARLQRAKKLQRLGTIERAVALNCRTEPAALQMLRGVCGEGKSVSHYGAGRAFDRHLAALILALEVAADVIGPKKTA